MTEKENAIFELVAIYKARMEQIANEMQSVENYIDLAELYERSAVIIRKLHTDTEKLTDGKQSRNTSGES